MSDTSEIEKKSLEAHVELCAERYRFLEEKMEDMDNKITSVSKSVADVLAVVQRISEKNTDRLIAWGVGIIGVLTTAIIYLLNTYVFK